MICPREFKSSTKSANIGLAALSLSENGRHIPYDTR